MIRFLGGDGVGEGCSGCRPLGVAASARVGALEQLVPGMLVEAALGPSVPPAGVEHDAPDEALPVVVARWLPASGQGQEG